MVHHTLLRNYVEKFFSFSCTITRCSSDRYQRMILVAMTSRQSNSDVASTPTCFLSPFNSIVTPPPPFFTRLPQNLCTMRLMWEVCEVPLLRRLYSILNSGYFCTSPALTIIFSYTLLRSKSPSMTQFSAQKFHLNWTSMKPSSRNKKPVRRLPATRNVGKKKCLLPKPELKSLSQLNVDLMFFLDG